MNAISHDVARSYQHFGRENLTEWELSALDAHVAVCGQCQNYAQALERVRQAFQRLKLAQWGRIHTTDGGLMQKIRARRRRNYVKQRLSHLATRVASFGVLVGLVIAFEIILLSLRGSPLPQAISRSGRTPSGASLTSLAGAPSEGAEPTATETFEEVASWSPKGFFPISSADGFMRALDASLPFQTLLPSELEAGCQLTLSGAEAQAGFRVLMPAVPPLGYDLHCVTYVASPRAVVLTYAAEDEPFPVVTITQWLGPTPASDEGGIGLTATIVPVSVGDMDAEYVAGNWWFDYPTSTTVQGHWDATFPVRRLRWVQNGHLMEIGIVDVADESGDPPWYPPHMLVAIAETLRSVAATELPSQRPLSGDAISMAIEEVSCPGSRTLVRVLVEAGRSYWGDLEATPPPHAMLRDVQLFNALGDSYAPDAAWGEPGQFDPIKGTIQFRITAAFEGLACDARELTFTSAVELGAIRTDGNVIVDIRDRTLGDEWRPTARISLAGMLIPIDEARITLVSSLEDGTSVEQPALELEVTPIEERGLRLQCLDFLWIAPEVDTADMWWSCESDASSITASIVGGPLGALLEDHPLPWTEIEFKVYATLLLAEPRTLTWLFE